jgi:hypothetical protein
MRRGPGTEVPLRVIGETEARPSLSSGPVRVFDRKPLGVLPRKHGAARRIGQPQSRQGGAGARRPRELKRSPPDGITWATNGPTRSTNSVDGPCG